MCSAKAITFLCNKHTDELRAMLSDLPWWIDRLTEAALGQTKLRDPGRRSQRANAIHGDDEVLPKCTCGHAETEHNDYYIARDGSARSIEQKCTAIDRDREMIAAVLEVDEDGQETEVAPAYEIEIEKPCHCAEYRPVANQARMRVQLLAAGGINSRAEHLLDAVHNTLTTWVRHLCEARGVVEPALTKPRIMAMWLKTNISAVVCDQGAGQFFSEIQDLVGDRRDEHKDGAIGRLINRPVPMRYLGPCRTYNERTRKSCGTQLQCREGVLEVTCPECRHVYNANHLQSLTENDLEHRQMTVDQILEYNRRIPEEYRIKERTLRQWRQKGLLKPSGYRRPGGRVVINRHGDDDEPLYLWSDVKKLRTERPARNILTRQAAVG